MIELDGFQCQTCGKWHEGIPLDYGYHHPDYWSESLRGKADCFLNADFCVIEKRDYFVRGLIEIPIIGAERFFRWGVWTSLSKTNFDKLVNLWNDPKLLDEPAYFGWLSNSIHVYPQTLNLKVNVQSRTIEHRPFMILEPADHPLSIEQRNGVSMDRLREIVERCMHR
jgi:hypothetical protein